MEDWGVINDWIGSVTNVLSSIHIDCRLDYMKPRILSKGYSRNKPFPAVLMLKRQLTACEHSSDKETIHCEFDITDSGLTWTSGDALGIYPINNPPEVDRLISAMRLTSSDNMQISTTGTDGSLRKALLEKFDLKNINPDLIVKLWEKATDPKECMELEALLKAGTWRQNLLLHEYLKEREVADVVEDYSKTCLPIEDIVSCLKPLQPRYYSISSSPYVDKNTVCVTTAVIRYFGLNHHRTGVTTTYLQDRLPCNAACSVFMSTNPDFRLPTDGNRTIIMIGPGTGLAPFRAFIQERIVLGHKGRNMLYFGCGHKSKDYLYKEELENWSRDGHITLRTAFSRDQAEKEYVQDLLKRDSSIIWSAVKQEMAHLYICGDARYMAHDVHEALVYIVQKENNMGRQAAEALLLELEDGERYQKDTWIT